MYFLLSARKRIATTLAPKQLEGYITRSVLVFGGMKISSMVYLSTEALKCLCGGAESYSTAIFPVVVISAMLGMILIYRLAILRVATTSISIVDIGAFVGLF